MVIGMKKLICVVFAVLFCFSIAACGKKEKEKTAEIDLQYYASAGEIPEIPCKLRSNVEFVKKQFAEKAEKATAESQETEVSSQPTESTAEEGTDIKQEPFQIVEGESTVWMDDGEWFFCYNKEKESDGIVCIATLSKAFGFEPGMIISQVKEKLDPLRLIEREAEEGELYVPYGDAPRTILEYTASDRTIQFVFEDNALVATILYDKTLRNN